MNGYSGVNMFPPVIKWLIGINVGIFLLGFVPMGVIDGNPVRLDDYMAMYGALWPVGSNLFMPWQYFTYMFLHGGLGHIFFNMLALWMFGMELENLWGSKRFLAYYLIAGLGAGIVHTVVTALMGTANGPAVGASGAIYGVLIAFGMLFPDRIIYVNFFIPMKAKYLVMIFIAYDLVTGIMGGDGVAHFAHLGGGLFGFLMLQIGGKMTLGGIFDRIPGFKTTSDPRMEAWERPSQQRRQPSNVIDVEFRDIARQQARRPVVQQMNFGADQERIDAILDKISKTGYQNLTEEEKTILLEASRKMK
jgi:membrane associated rhomboid family serine protease